jgi:hypothetical protein
LGKFQGKVVDLPLKLRRYLTVKEKSSGKIREKFGSNNNTKEAGKSFKVESLVVDFAAAARRRLEARR